MKGFSMESKAETCPIVYDTPELQLEGILEEIQSHFTDIIPKKADCPGGVSVAFVFERAMERVGQARLHQLARNKDQDRMYDYLHDRFPGFLKRSITPADCAIKVIEFLSGEQLNKVTFAPTPVRRKPKDQEGGLFDQK
jgi:hypothetical protein